MAATALFFLCLLTVATADDLQTLLQIKTDFGGSANQSAFDSWELRTPACQFRGVTCDSAGAVTEIELSYRNLSGAVPVDTICRLKSLEKLSLGFNYLSGRVGDGLNNCSSLKYLDLGNNAFSGDFPDISSVTGLLTLYANASGFTGIFPWRSILGMRNLQVLSLGDNPFRRTPLAREVTSLANLNWLYLSNCGLSGEIPEDIGNLVGLIDLELAQNYLSGEIPAGISNLNKLWQLELYQNCWKIIKSKLVLSNV